MKKTVFESINMASTKYAERIFDAVANEDIENGTFGYLDELANDETVIYNFVPGFKEGEPVVVVDNPAWTEDESKITNQRRDNYINEAGVPFRVRKTKVTDEFGITIEGITNETRTLIATVTDFKNNPIYLTIDTTTGKLIASNNFDANYLFVARVMRKRMIGAILSTPLRNYGYSNAIYEAKIITLAQ